MILTEDIQQPLMVTIRCFAYNQEKYIRDCLEGFVMQQTNFRFEAIVHDDASTDGTVAIIKEYAEKYPDIIKPILETENQYSKHDGSLGRIMDEHTHGKYVAYCEGDDYWIDPLKLQKQIDFLETHPDYSMCWTDGIMKTNGVKQKLNRYSVSGETPMTDIIEKGGAFVPTCSIVVRKSVLDSMPKEAKGWYVGDFPLQMWCGWKGKVWYMVEPTIVYRYMSMGSWTEQYLKKSNKAKYLNMYLKEYPMMAEFNKLTEFRYNDSFEIYAAQKTYNQLLWAEAYDKLKPYYKLRQKHGIYTGKVETLLVFGYPRLAKVLMFVIKLKNRVLTAFR